MGRSFEAVNRDEFNFFLFLNLGEVSKYSILGSFTLSLKFKASLKNRGDVKKMSEFILVTFSLPSPSSLLITFHR